MAAWRDGTLSMLSCAMDRSSECGKGMKTSAIVCEADSAAMDCCASRWLVVRETEAVLRSEQ